MLAELEGAEDALGFASGMAAISSTVLAFVAPGDRMVASATVYPDAYRLFETLLPRMRHRGRPMSTGATWRRSPRRCPARGCSTWRARRAG